MSLMTQKCRNQTLTQHAKRCAMKKVLKAALLWPVQIAPNKNKTAAIRETMMTKDTTTAKGMHPAAIMHANDLRAGKISRR